MSEGYARGRVNLIGENTDYNGGLVLPAPLALGVHVRAEPADSLDVAGDHADERSGWLQLRARRTQSASV